MPSGMSVSARPGAVEGKFDPLAIEQNRGQRLLRFQPLRGGPEDPVGVAVDCREAILDDGRLDDCAGFGGAAGVQEPPRHAGIVAHARADKLLSRAIGIDIALCVRDVGERMDQLPCAPN